MRAKFKFPLQNKSCAIEQNRKLKENKKFKNPSSVTVVLIIHFAVQRSRKKGLSEQNKKKVVVNSITYGLHFR